MKKTEKEDYDAFVDEMIKAFDKTNFGKQIKNEILDEVNADLVILNKMSTSPQLPKLDKRTFPWKTFSPV